VVHDHAGRPLARTRHGVELLIGGARQRVDDGLMAFPVAVEQGPPGFGDHWVRTSTPSSVTSTVCSNWAVRLPSAVTAVHPSSQIFTCQLPAVIIGSMVNVMPDSIGVVRRGS